MPRKKKKRSQQVVGGSGRDTKKTTLSNDRPTQVRQRATAKRNHRLVSRGFKHGELASSSAHVVNGQPTNNLPPASGSPPPIYTHTCPQTQNTKNNYSCSHTCDHAVASSTKTRNACCGERMRSACDEMTKSY